MRDKGEHLGIYHIGTTEEVTIADLAHRIAGVAGVRSACALGGAPGQHAARCPDISKLSALGYRPRVPLDEGLPPTLQWYWDHEAMAPTTTQ